MTVVLLLGVGLLNYLDRMMITTMRSSVTVAIPMSDAQFGLLTSLFLWVYGISSPMAGYVADRFSRSRVILFSLLSWSVVTWLTGHATTYGQLLTTRALMGLTEACYIPAAFALIVDYHRGDTRSKAEGLHISGIHLGAGLGGLGGWIAEHHDWTTPFTIFGLVGIGYSFVLATFLRDAPREKVEVEALPRLQLVASFKSLFRESGFILACLYWGLLGVASWAINGWMPTYLNEQFALGQGRAGLTSTGYLESAIVVGILVGGAWADRWYRTNERGRIYVPCIGLCIAVPAMLFAVNTDVLALAIVGLVVYGLTRAFVESNMMPVLCMVTDPRYRATGFGFLNLFATVIGGCTIYAGGLVRDANININRVFMFGAICLLICAGLIVSIKSRK